MPEAPSNPPHPDDLVLPEPEHSHHDHEGHKKHKAKVRAAWISFVGRIIAQIAGAAATLVIGLAVLNKYGTSRGNPGEPGRTDTNALAADLHRIDRSPAEIDLAVLPFESLSDATHGHLADGITESLIAQLARLEGMHVISRTSSMRYKGLRKSIPDVAAELGVDLIVEGTVVADAGRVRVTAQLVDAVADHELWSRSYERANSDWLALQTDVSAAIAREVNATVTPAVGPRLAAQPRVEPAAYEQYVRGRSAARAQTRAGLQAALQHFDQAIGLGPTFAPAHAGLAAAHVLLATSPHAAPAPEGALARARTPATRAIELDPSNALAHAALAVVSHRLDWDWVGSEEAFRRAITLGPGESLPHQWYAVLLAEQGRHREALAEAEFAVELDPLLADAHATLGLVHYYAGRYDRAAAASRRALDISPGLAASRLMLAWSLLEQGHAAAAIAVCEERPWRTGLDEMLSTLADAHWRRGQRVRAEAIRLEILALDLVSPSALLRLHLSRGEIDEAFGVLDRALGARPDVVRTIKVDPLFARLRHDRRFAAVLERLKLGDGQ